MLHGHGDYSHRMTFMETDHVQINNNYSDQWHWKKRTTGMKSEPPTVSWALIVVSIDYRWGGCIPLPSQSL